MTFFWGCILPSIPLLAGFALDSFLGDPEWLYHPVRLIGTLIRSIEGKLRRICPKTPTGARLGGAVLATMVPAATMLAVWLLLSAAKIHLLVWMIAEALSCYFLLAVKSLRVESMKVYTQLQDGNLPAARVALSMIVGRDTECLEEVDIVKAAVETVAENTTDGIVAPLFYTILGGSILGWGYKAVNTLDSMVGYKNEKYRYFGTASARLDDLLGLLPARVAAFFMVLASWLCRMDAKSALRVCRRDHANHPSPNSAYTEAACAGALGIQLAGGASYFGEWKEKPTIGDSARLPEREDIPRACHLMQVTAFLCLLLLVLVKWMVIWFFCAR